jgi:hypothetical protein
LFWGTGLSRCSGKSDATELLGVTSPASSKIATLFSSAIFNGDLFVECNQYPSKLDYFIEIRRKAAAKIARWSHNSRRQLERDIEAEKMPSVRQPKLRANFLHSASFQPVAIFNLEPVFE